MCYNLFKIKIHTLLKKCAKIYGKIIKKLITAKAEKEGNNDNSRNPQQRLFSHHTHNSQIRRAL